MANASNENANTLKTILLVRLITLAFGRNCRYAETYLECTYY